MDAPAGRNFDPHHARVLVVGPMAAGKTTLVHSLCHGARGGTSDTPHPSPPPTVGCNVDVKVLSGRNADRSIEFWDVGGNPDAALARGMFFEGCDAAGVLLVYDVSNPRSLRQVRTWAKELDSAGVPILEGSSRTATTSEGLGTKGSRGVGAFYHGESDDDREALADLEGGSSGAAGKAIEGRVPLLVVGSKDDVGEGVRRAGAELASELGAGHVTVCGLEVADGEPFEIFFGEVFRYHCGQRTLDEGDTPERKQWTNDQDSYFPATTTRVDDGGRLNSAEYHRYQRGGGNESPEHAREQHNGTGTVAARRMDNISGSLGEGATARSSGGKMWPPTRRAVFPFAAAATSTSQKKQS